MSAEKIHQEFASIADELRLIGPGVGQSGKVATTRTLLEQDIQEKWLLIFDNVSHNSDVISVLDKVLPQCNPKGNILLTTLDADFAKSLANAHSKRHAIVALQPLIEDDVLQLFEERAKSWDRERSDPPNVWT